MPKRHTDMHENVIICVRREAEGRYATISAFFEHDLTVFEHTVLRIKRVD